MAFAPTIYFRSDAGLKPAPGADWGPLGPIHSVTFHHSAGPRAKTKAQAQALHASYQAQHAEDYRGNDIGYHFSLDDLGRVYRLRPIDEKGTHVGGWNTGNVGIMLHGNYMNDRLNWRQRRTLRWLFRGGFQKLGLPRADQLLIRGHQEWPSHNSNACPGTNLQRHVRYLRNH